MIELKSFPELNNHEEARKWILMQIDLGLAKNTIVAYSTAVNEFIRFCKQDSIDLNNVTQEHIAKFIRYLVNRPSKLGENLIRLDSRAGLSNATIQQRLTAIRLFFDYLIELNIRDKNPVGRGRYTPTNKFGGSFEKGIFPRFHKLPWIPTNEIWERILQAASKETIRNKFMLALAYDGALRREELCKLETVDIDPSKRLILIRAENTKSKRDRIIHYSVSTADLYSQYLKYRKFLSKDAGTLFLSESNRNKGKPISIWTWTKVVETIAERANAPQFTTHSLRHLCLTDLARAGWDIYEIAEFAGHKNTNTTLQYIHLSGQDLIAKFESCNETLHRWNAVKFKELIDHERAKSL